MTRSSDRDLAETSKLGDRCRWVTQHEETKDSFREENCASSHQNSILPESNIWYFMSIKAGINACEDADHYALLKRPARHEKETIE